MRAWDRLFNEFLTQRGIAEPYTSADYFEYVDGRPRYDGVRAFLASRGIDLEFGEPTDDPSGETVCALGNRKNGYFTEQLATGVRVFDGTVALIEDLTERGKRLAVVGVSDLIVVTLGEDVLIIPKDRAQEVKAIVETAPGVKASAALADELIAFARTRVARYMVPKSIDFIDTLPRLPTGKLLKRSLRERYWPRGA